MKPGDEGLHVQTTWIPEKFAKIGKILELLGDNGWEVIGVSTERRDSWEVRERSQDWRRQRKASDM
jgi:hypothetical protein